jgi:hypothetical protein
MNVIARTCTLVRRCGFGVRLHVNGQPLVGTKQHQLLHDPLGEPHVTYLSYGGASGQRAGQGRRVAGTRRHGSDQLGM